MFCEAFGNLGRETSWSASLSPFIKVFDKGVVTRGSLELNHPSLGIIVFRFGPEASGRPRHQGCTLTRTVSNWWALGSQQEEIND